jgi:hypothetical protein
LEGDTPNPGHHLLISLKQDTRLFVGGPSPTYPYANQLEVKPEIAVIGKRFKITLTFPVDARPRIYPAGLYGPDGKVDMRVVMQKNWPKIGTDQGKQQPDQNGKKVWVVNCNGQHQGSQEMEVAMLDKKDGKILDQESFSILVRNKDGRA